MSIRRRWYSKFMLYVCVSLLSASADWLAFFLMFESGIGIILSQAVARVTGGAMSFTANKIFTFKAKSAHFTSRQIHRFILLYAMSYTLSLTIVWIGANVLETPIYLTKLVADATCFLFNFIMMNAYVFQPFDKTCTSHPHVVEDRAHVIAEGAHDSKLK